MNAHHPNDNGVTILRVILLILPFIGVTQKMDLPFVHYSTDEGLSEGTINAIHQDSRGFIWFGTSNGLNRFDGYEFLHFFADEENHTTLISNTITSIDENEDGLLFIGTDAGLSIYDYRLQTFQSFAHDPLDPSSIGQGQVNQVFVDDKQRVWIGTSSGGLSRLNLDNGTFKRYEHDPNNPSSLGSNVIYGIQQAAPDKLWIGSTTHSVDLMDIESGVFTSYPFLPENKSAYMRCLYVANDNRVWVTTENAGIFVLESTNDRFEPYLLESRSGNSINNVRVVKEDSEGNMWFGTDGFGVQRRDLDGNWDFIVNDPFFDNSLISNQVYTIYFDRSGGMWVGVFKKGLSYHNSARHRFRTESKIAGIESSLVHNSVLAIYPSNRGGVWIGTDGGGLDYFDPSSGRFTHYQHDPDNPNSLSTNVIKSLYETPEGIVWAGTYLGGINRFNPFTGEVRRFNSDPTDVNSLAVQHVWSIEEDAQGYLWFGLLGGLDRYDRQTGEMRFYGESEDETGLSNGSVYVLKNDSKGRLWVGTQAGGINRYDPVTDSFIWYRAQDGKNTLPSDNINSIFESMDGTIWVGTSKGLATYEMDSDSFVAYDVNSNLPAINIQAIEQDLEGILWISTSMGLVSFSPGSGEIRHFTKNDGLQGNEFNYTASARLNDGTLFFGGLNGFNRFHPRQVVKNTYVPSLALTSLNMGGIDVNAFDTVNNRVIIEESINSVDELVLTHKEKFFTLEFASMDFTAPGQNKYEYLLENYDEEWTQTDAEGRQALYMNLSPGEYLFRLKGSNSDGLWSEEEKNLVIRVLPPWWATWWFRVLVGSVIISYAVILVRARNSRVRRDKQQLEDQIRQATEEVISRNQELQEQQEALKLAVDETNQVVKVAVNEGSFSRRISTDGKSGSWLQLSQSINQLFDSIVLPMGIINEIVNKMADGDLTGRFNEAAEGEIKLLALNLNTALDSFSQLLGDVIMDIQSVDDASKEMQGGSEEMQVSTEEIASAIAEMSKGAQQQVTKVDESSAVVENVQQVSQRVGDQASAINEAAERGVDLSENGRKVIQELSERMKKSLQLSEQTHESIKDLTRVSGEINRILNIIKEIAGQTNLLALNAAIEAAQAGESGRGFAVVAEEIRKLAEDSRKSTKEIETLVTDVQNKTNTTAELVSEMGDSIRKGESSSSDGIQSFNEIADSYTRTLELSNRILEDAENQKRAVDEIRSITETVVVIAEETASGTEEVAASASQLSSGMRNYKSLNDKVSHIASELIDKVRKFKV